MAARREQNRRSQRRVRKKSLYSENPSDIGRTPDEVRQHLAHVLNEWAELAPDTTGVGAFARSLWLSTTVRIGQGYTIHVPTADLIADLQCRQGLKGSAKKRHAHMSHHLPGAAATPRSPNSDWHLDRVIGPNERRCVGIPGLSLRHREWRDDTGKFCGGVSGLEFFAYPSWSHTPEAPRWRIGVPSTQLVRPDFYALILHTVVDRLEAAG
jgi:hypothetical protein